MCEILFRGFSPVIQEWVHGYYVKTKVGGKEICTIIPLDDLHKTLSEKRWFEVIPSTVGQFTGLTDKDGKKIFEGDIVSLGGDEIGVVEYDDDCAGYRLSGDGCSLCVSYGNDRLVIGNIHDNPELLEVDSRGKN